MQSSEEEVHKCLGFKLGRHVIVKQERMHPHRLRFGTHSRQRESEHAEQCIGASLSQSLKILLGPVALRDPEDLWDLVGAHSGTADPEAGAMHRHVIVADSIPSVVYQVS